MEFEKLNLERAKEVLDNLFKDWLDIPIEITDDKIEGETTITAKAYDHDIEIFLSFDRNGCGCINFFLGVIDKDEQALDLVNTFNNHANMLKAEIAGPDDYGDIGLFVVREVRYCTTETIAKIVQDAIIVCLDLESTVKYLKPLIDLTRPSQEGSSAIEYEKLNLENAKKILDNLFKDWLDVTTEIKDDHIDVVATLIEEAYDDDIDINMSIFDNGYYFMCILFDYLNKNEKTLDLVNSFNDNVLYLKATFGDDDQLTVSYDAYVAENTIAHTVNKVLDFLVDEDTVKYLKPLIDLTHPSQEGSSAIEYEKLNLENAKKILDNLFKDWLDVTTEIEDDKLTCEVVITAEDYDDDIHMMMLFSDTGYCYICFYFDYLDKNEETLDLVNSFNENVIYLRAAFNKKEGNLIVRYDAYVTEDTIAQTVQKVLDNLVSEDTVKYLKPLTELTHPKDED